MEDISKRTIRLLAFVQRDIIQHLGFGLVAYVIIFCCFAVFAWYEGKVELLATLDYQAEAFWKVFSESLLFTLLMGVPVYFCYGSLYWLEIHKWLLRPIISKKVLRAGEFYLFLFACALFAIAFGLLYSTFFRHIFDMVNMSWFVIAAIIYILTISVTGASFSLRNLKRLRALERLERQQAIHRQRTAEQQLAFIKHQIRPHFLFNTLANLQILAKQKSDRLPDLMTQLTRLLRHLIYQTDDKLVALEKELKFITSYVDLQELSMPKYTNLHFEISGEIPLGRKIAPMILLIFIENCFKHYDKISSKGKAIEINIHLEEGLLELRTENTIRPNAKNESGNGLEEESLGIKAILKNLTLVYQDQYIYEVEKTSHLYRTVLQLPLL